MLPKITVLLLFEMGLFAGVGAAQNILNDTLYVNSSVVAELVFHDPSEGTIWGGDKSYEIKGGTKTSLLVSARRQNAPTQALIVTEGPRTHKFILVYRSDAAAGRHDYSDLQRLATSVKAREEPAGKTLPVHPPAKMGTMRPSGRDKDNIRQWIKEAEAFYTQQQWDSAKARYTKVLPYKTRELAVAQQKLKEITAMQEQKARDKEAQYAASMKHASALIEAQKFKEAEIALLKALIIKPGDPAAQKMLQDLKATLARQEKEENARLVQELLKKGDQALKAKRYLAAEEAYRAIIKLDPAHATAGKRLKEQGGKANGERFGTAKAKGDSLFKVKKWTEAKGVYEAAAKVKPKDAYVQGQLQKVKLQLRTEQQKINYAEALQNADKARDDKDFERALSEYQRAKRIFPDSVYPGRQIDFINRARMEQADKQGNDKLNAKPAGGKSSFYFQHRSKAINGFALEQFEKRRLLTRSHNRSCILRGRHFEGALQQKHGAHES